MKTNKWILGGLMAMAITACTSDELVENTNPTLGKEVTVTAYAPGDKANSRVSFTDDNTSKVTLSWNESESFSVVYHTTAQTFSKTEEGNSFTGVLPYDEEKYQDYYYAVYPALPANTSLTTANTVPFDLSTQTGKLDESKTYMRAESDNGFTYRFEHCTAILKATFTGIPDEETISKVVVKTHTGSKVDGNLNLTDGTMTSGSKNTITINYATAVDASTSVYIYLPPMTMDKKKLSFTVYTSDNKYYEGKLGAEAATSQPADDENTDSNQGKGIEAGKLYAASVALELADMTPYVTFSSTVNQNFSLASFSESISVVGLEYSVNGNDWQSFSNQILNFGGDAGDLRLRGKCPNGTGNPSEFIMISLSGSNVICSGDIRTLVDWENYLTTSTENASFIGLFMGCTALSDASGLQLISKDNKMALGCYAYMFVGCTGLTSAPVLPATTLAESCYSFMFSGCTSLATAPALPATTLTESCYDSMFLGCTGLTTAPTLPATSLAQNCYDSMFSGCTSLTTAPELPAESLAVGCYLSMFSGCTNLATAPALPATSLAVSCYAAMFSGCTSLTSVPANLLPATSLAQNCYNSMFSGCIGLTSAPALPATSLSSLCYASMFSGCIGLTSVPANLLPATSLAQNCYDSMFSGCIGLTSAPALPAISLSSLCYNKMFSGCTSLTTAPELPAESLAVGCYLSMFSGCTNLSAITMLATDISASDCLKDWVNSVSANGTFYKRSNATWKTDGVIPAGWAVVNVSSAGLSDFGYGGSLTGTSSNSGN